MGAYASCFTASRAKQPDAVITEPDNPGLEAQRVRDGVPQCSKQPDSGAASLPSTPYSTIAAGTAPPAAASHKLFLKWAEKHASAEGKPVDDFINSNIHSNGTSSSGSACNRTPSTGSSSYLHSRASTSFDASTPNSASTSAACAPYQPHDAFLHGPPKPACHEERSTAAIGIQQQQATRDGEIESMLEALATVFGCEMVGATLLTGECINIFAGRGGLSAGICPERWGSCGWSFMNTNHELVVVENMNEDARYAANYFVTDPDFHVATYFAAPLISSNGHRLGTLCIMGQEPRKFDATRAQFLANMAELLVRQLERNWAMQLAGQKAGEGLERSLACYDMAYMLVDVSKQGWNVLFMNLAAESQLGLEWDACKALMASQPASDKPIATGVGLHMLFDLQQARTTWAPHMCEFTVREVQGAHRTPLEGRSFTLTFRLATSDGLDSEQPFYVGVPSWLNTATDNFGKSLFFMQVSEAADSSCDANWSGSHASSASTLSSWSTTLFAGDSPRPFIPRGFALGSCPVDGLVLGPLLGKGSYGLVYRGVYKGMQVAVKIVRNLAHLRTTDAGEPLEAMLTQGINHLGIMRTITYAYSKHKTSCWMLFEYCDCACVQDAVLKGWFRTDRRPTHGGINLRTVALTAYEIASAMGFLHKHDIVHGDLKAGNVMLSTSSINPHGFTAKVGDFGLARHPEVGPNCTSSNDYGTVTHMPPEVLLDGNVGKPMDVYSFGVLLWEMLTGARAWAGMRHAQVICQVALMRRQLAVPSGLPAPMQSLLARCLAYKVADRCTFEEVLGVLTDFLQTSRDDDLTTVQLVMTQAVAEEAEPVSSSTISSSSTI